MSKRRKLTKLPPLVGKLESRISYVDRTPSAQRWASSPWLAWYGLKRWKDLRKQVLLRDGYVCQMRGCGKLISKSSEAVADHIKPHRGNDVLFWDADNLQTLCKACHNRTKQAEDQESKYTRGVWY